MSDWLSLNPPRIAVELNKMKKNITYNIKLTQHYLSSRTKNSSEKISDVLRTIPPHFNNKLIYDPNSNIKDWLIDYFVDGNILKDIFNYQMETKKNIFKQETFSPQIMEGKILCFHYYETLICGGSQQCSDGFIDNYNFPPIDTWIWIGEIDDKEVLLAWIPIEYLKYCQEGIDCNPEGCIEWLDMVSSEFEKEIIK